jgi:hypothetical protein
MKTDGALTSEDHGLHDPMKRLGPARQFNMEDLQGRKDEGTGRSI